jgi:hypothetical protein
MPRDSPLLASYLRRDRVEFLYDLANVMHGQGHIAIPSSQTNQVFLGGIPVHLEEI